MYWILGIIVVGLLLNFFLSDNTPDEITCDTAAKQSVRALVDSVEENFESVMQRVREELQNPHEQFPENFTQEAKDHFLIYVFSLETRAVHNLFESDIRDNLNELRVKYLSELTDIPEDRINREEEKYLQKIEQDIENGMAPFSTAGGVVYDLLDNMGFKKATFNAKLDIVGYDLQLVFAVNIITTEHAKTIKHMRENYDIVPE
jgi:hypothetical protein